MHNLRKLWLLLALASSALAQPPADDRISLKLDTSEADAVLAILNANATNQAVSAEAWQRVFASVPYQRLKKREASMRREFSDDDFKHFVLSPELAGKRDALAQTLERWKRADLRSAASRILPYLPADARIRASVYPVIKPQSNSFVFETDTDPAIFLYLDPEKSQASFENTVAHEMHHIGLASAAAVYGKIADAAPEPQRSVLNWITGFGEGLAVLAAAGSADVHPLASEPEADRIRWDQDMRFWTHEFSDVNQFFLDILHGGFKDKDVIAHMGYHFFGYRGAWYQVGYKMAVVVERKYGRPALLEGMTDPRKLLLRYNQAAAEINSTGPAEKLPLWSDEIIAALK